MKHVLKRREHKRRRYRWGAFVPPAHQWTQTSVPFVWQGDGTERGKRQVGVVGGSLAGQAAPAKQRVRCDGKVSTLFRQSHSLISDKSEKRASFRLGVHRVFVSPLHLYPTIIKVRAHQLRACIELAERERQRDRQAERKRDDVLLIPPVAAEQWASLTFISVIFICWQGRKMQGTLLSGSSCHFRCTMHLYLIYSWFFSQALNLASFIHPTSNKGKQPGRH